VWISAGGKGTGTATPEQGEQTSIGVAPGGLKGRLGKSCCLARKPNGRRVGGHGREDENRKAVISYGVCDSERLSKEMAGGVVAAQVVG
jgi:hypothetical protein